MNIDNALINYFFDYGDTLEGLLFVNDRPGQKITGINIVTNYDDENENNDVIQFYNDKELIETIKSEELENIFVGTNYANNIPVNHEVVFDLKGFNDMRLFIDLDFEELNKVS